MRISDWSSDVCSSDLGRQRRVEHRARSSMNNPRDSEALCIACVGARPVEGGALPGTRIAAGIVMGFMAGRPGQGLRTADGNSVAADSLHAPAASAVPAAAAYSSVLFMSDHILTAFGTRPTAIKLPAQPH